MQNFIGQVSPMELVVSLYHPKLFHFYKSGKAFLDKAFKGKNSELDELTAMLYKNLGDVDSGLTAEGFKLKCESLGYSADAVKMYTDTFQKYCDLENDDYRALHDRIKNYVINEAIKTHLDKYNNDHDVEAFIDNVAGLKVTDLSSDFNDEKLFSSSLFGDIDIDSVSEEFSQGVIRSSLDVINSSMTHGGYLRSTCVVFAAPTKCGKSMIAMQEVGEFLKQDQKVVYVALGDLKQYDLLTRIASQINDRPIAYTEKNLKHEVELAIKKVPQLKTNLDILFLAPDKFSAEDIVNYLHESYAKDGVTKLHDWADVIVIDYDANIRTSFADNMYKKGEEAYQTLYPLVNPNKLVIILAQTAKPSWVKDIVDITELGESSRKAQIVDMVITISHPQSENGANNVGCLNLCANRRGGMKSSWYMRDISGRFREIDSDTYSLLKAATDAKTMIPNIELYSDQLNGTFFTTIRAKTEKPTFQKAYDEADEILNCDE
ncbi:MAG: hypothetical protein MJZ34_02490 [Paludibacteraceae bacterium]|nr:hypothetical protein [Paludibacteraceae bacterium]